MRKITAFAISALLLLQNTPVLYALEAATVKSVRVSADSVYITTDRPVEYKTFTLGQPPKLVLEIPNSKMGTLQEIPANGALLRRVRTGQFQVNPSVSRVVMELTRKAAFEITRRGTELIVMLGERAQRPDVKDAPGAPQANQGIRVISPDSTPQPARPAAKPAVVTLEPDFVKPADLNRESVPVIPVRSRNASVSSVRNIMDSLSREPISFDYNEADVREVLDMMAAKAGVNIIYSDDVTGTITISLSKVPFSEAFETILNIKGLTAQQVGDNILRIASPKTLINEQKSAMLQTRVFFLSYSTALAMKTQIDAVVAAEGRSAKCSNDDVNNAVIITDTPIGIDSTARLIRSLDRIPQQVMIEVKLVEVDLSSSFDLGVSWGFNNNTAGTSGTFNFPGPVPGGTTYAGSFTFGKILGDYSVNAIIAAAAHKGKAKVLSDPKVATLNNKPATINITDQTPYDQQTISIVNGVQTTAHAYSNVVTGITLNVTPTINSDGRISMHLIPSVIQLSGVPNGVAPPPTATRNTDTNVIVKNGETVVIGGLINDTQNDDVFKVPILGDIPLIGILFRKKSVLRTRKELLIFVTPKIIES